MNQNVVDSYVPKMRRGGQTPKLLQVHLKSESRESGLLAIPINKGSNVSFLAEKSNLDAHKYGSIQCCPHVLLRCSLALYGFSPTNSKDSVVRRTFLILYRFVMVICLSMGFYSIRGVTANNHGSNYLAGTFVSDSESSGLIRGMWLLIIM